MKKQRDFLLIFSSISNLGSCGIASYNAYNAFAGKDIARSVTWVCFAIILATLAIKIYTLTSHRESRT